jgi:hypothetical protein
MQACDVQEPRLGDAVDGQCRFFGLVPLERKKEVAHLLRHQRSKNDPGWGKAAIAPSHLHIASCAFLSAAILARCPIGRLFKIAQF